MEQLSLFEPETLDKRQCFVLLPRYRRAFLRNDYWQSAVSLLLVEKGDWKTSLGDLEQGMYYKDSLIAIGYLVVTPAPSQSVPHARVVPEKPRIAIYHGEL